MFHYIAICLVALLAVAGCSKSEAEGSRATAARTTSVTEQQAIDIAKAALAEQHGWANAATYAARPAGLGWAVTAMHDSGGNGLVSIGGDGSIIKMVASDE